MRPVAWRQRRAAHRARKLRGRLLNVAMKLRGYHWRHPRGKIRLRFNKAAKRYRRQILEIVFS